ncbi:MAG TPA: vitamin K epoxide reductase family protein, partial [Candidatus Dormibacteraeota bacterium]|nr:vitamin K epoxide reductase family protein [Candidatus Dormibacteraeota bacterium]
SRAQLAWSGLGLVTVIGLVFIEIVRLGAVCLWCTVAHVLVLITFLLVITIRQPAAEGGTA